jgi:hypothetical protein
MESLHEFNINGLQPNGERERGGRGVRGEKAVISEMHTVGANGVWLAYHDQITHTWKMILLWIEVRVQLTRVLVL